MDDVPREVTIASEGLRLFGRWSEVANTAGALVLLPGLGFHTFEYERLQTLLAERGRSSLALDYRGHGRSGGPPGDWTLELLVADVRAAVDWILARHVGPVILLGNSLGAMAAVATANADARVAAVVASNCPAHVGDFLMTPLRRALFAIAKLISLVLPLRISVNHFYAYSDLIEDRALVDRIAQDDAIRKARRLSVAAYRALIDEWDGVREVARLAKPLLLVQGSRDRLQPPEQTDLLLDAAHEPKYRVRLATGHLPNLERPDLLADAVLSWLPKIGLGP
ncbi:MAG: alpha/beta fold hydrolase [Myxococcales bacterium]|nr:alpha/beta fold hydrolase [Myxococcales bacterium]